MSDYRHCMMNGIAKGYRAAFLFAGLLFATCLTGRAADSTNRQFGFTGPEIFPIDALIGQIHAADLDGDGLIDLAVVNNVRSRITFLYNRTGKTNAPALNLLRGQVNELPPDSRFRIDSLATEKRIAAFLVADLNGDGRPDLAYYGEPRELVVRYNQGTNGWSAPRRWPIDDAQLSQNGLIIGDLNGDGRPDLLLLAENHVYLLAQTADHQLADPEKIPFTGSVKAIQAHDINGDGRDDLLLVNWDSATPFRFRLQNAAGQLGPEIHLTHPSIRSYAAEDLDGDRKMEIVTIATQSGRAQVSNFKQKPAEALSGGFKEGQFQVQPLQRTTKPRRGVAWADLNGDKLPDLLVAEPDSGQLTLFLQKPDGTWDAAHAFPTFSGCSDIAVADWDGDGKPEIFLLSSEERQVGMTRYENGKIAFPQILPIEGRPLAIAAGRLAGTTNAVAVLVENDGKKDLYLRTSDGQVTRQKLAESFKSSSATMIAHDVNQDGLMDLVILIPYEKVKVLVQQAGKGFEEVDVTAPGGTVEQPWVSIADVDGNGKPELLFPQKNFLRAVVLQSEPAPAGSTNKTLWSFRVREQINGAASNSRIVGAAALTQPGKTNVSLFLLDAEKKAITVCDRDATGTWQVTKSVLIPVTEFTALQPLALGSTTANSLGFIGLNSVAWMSLAGDTWQIEDLDGYETPIKDGYLNDVVLGDLNSDGRKDLVFLETGHNYLDLVTYEKPHTLVPANRWQVFEERTFRNRRGDMPEPREALIQDVTGDGKKDLIVIIHDRILVYPQE